MEAISSNLCYEGGWTAVGCITTTPPYLHCLSKRDNSFSRVVLLLGTVSKARRIHRTRTFSWGQRRQLLSPFVVINSRGAVSWGEPIGRKGSSIRQQHLPCDSRRRLQRLPWGTAPKRSRDLKHRVGKLVSQEVVINSLLRAE